VVVVVVVAVESLLLMHREFGGPVVGAGLHGGYMLMIELILVAFYPSTTVFASRDVSC
jgi:hypothetical protein